jgi:3-oxoacyl-[acyl-carrier protein] reductase
LWEEKMKLLSKNALVTGASRGIGRAVAIGLAKEGANVVINYNSSKGASEEVKSEIEKMGRNAILFKADVTKKDEVEKMVKTTQDAFGEIDILVNNAGIYPNSLVVDTSEEIWDRVINTSLKGMFLCCQAVIRSMMERKSGKIVNITSGRGTVGAARGAHYATAKAGIMGFTKSLAQELAPYRINVNAIAPGTVDTDMLRWGKNEKQIEEIEERSKNPYLANGIAKPEDIVRTVIFLTTEDCAFMTGQVISMKTPHFP